MLLAATMMLFAFVSCEKPAPGNDDQQEEPTPDPDPDPDPNPDPDPDPDPETLTITLEISDITETSALVTAIPSNDEAPYYFDVTTPEVLAQFSDEEFMQAYIEELVALGEPEGLTPEETLEILCSVGEDAWQPTGMTPGATYVAFAFGLNYDGTITTELITEEFTTLTNESGEMNPSLQPFIGSFVANFESSLGWVDAGNGYVSPQDLETPTQESIRIEPFTGQGATGNEVVIYGLSALDELFGEEIPMLAQWVEEQGALCIMAGQTLGTNEDGSSVAWLPVCILSDGVFSPVTGEFIAYAIYPDNMTSEAGVVQLGDGRSAEVFSMEVYAANFTTGQLSLYSTEVPYNAGNFELVSTSGSSITLKGVRRTSIGSFSVAPSYQMATFSVVK